MNNVGATSPSRFVKNAYQNTIETYRSNPMETEKQKRLEAAGWKIGTVADFLDLTSEESTIVEMRLMLSRSLKERRKVE
jgi:hypothetical protein